MVGDGDITERLGADDMATRREEQFRAAALAHQAQVNAAARTPCGTCAYCGERCLPRAVYCDDDCRADHERELLVRRRQGRAL